jgi:serine/threonine-protein kinase
LIGTVLDGSYRIEGMLAEGGMGAVYRATQLRLDKPVAVKVMSHELAASTDALARFHREARVTSGLGHPHIVQVFDFSTTPTGDPYLVMELLEGEDLEHRLRRVGRLPAADVVRIVKQVASALAAAHAKAIVHRDLKPANIYLLRAAGETDFVKVLDFGISKVRTASTRLTRDLAIVGTPNYMSPEQAEGKVEDVDDRTDQWALACIACECLSGEMLFAGDNSMSVLYKIVHTPPPVLLPGPAGPQPRVEDVLFRALARDKNQRFPSVDDFAAALEATVTGAPSVTLPSVPRTVELTPTVVDTEPAKRAPPTTTLTETVGEMGSASQAPRPRPKPWIWALATGAAVLLLLAGFLFLRPRPAPKPVAASPAPAAPATPEPRSDLAPVPRVVSPRAAPVESQTPESKPGSSSASRKTVSEAKPKKLRRTNPPETQGEKLDRARGRADPHQPPEQPNKGQDKWRLD